MFIKKKEHGQEEEKEKILAKQYSLCCTKVVGLIPVLGPFSVCGVCRFSLCMCGFSPGSPASYMLEVFLK